MENGDGYCVLLESLWCCDLAAERSLHYFLVFSSVYWDFARFIPLTAFGLKSLLQAALTADAVKAASLPSFDSWLIPICLMIGGNFQIQSEYNSVCFRVWFSDIFHEQH